MAGTINVDTLKADSNLKLQIASANVAFIDVNGLTIVGNSLNVGGGRIVVTSNNSISTPSVIGANLVTATGTTALGITANGQITTANAPFILTGGQLQFPATQSASSNANTLDDYEEGTWTPVYTGATGSAGTAAYSSSGAYIKVGNLVTLRGTITVSDKGSWSGKILITGCPFPPSTSVYPAVSVGIWYNYTTSVLSVSGYLNGTGGQIIPLHQTAASTTNTETLVSNIATGWTYEFSLSYPI